MLERLNQVNDVEIYSVEDEKFKSFGRVLKGYDFSELISYMEEKTEIPQEGNCYVASVSEMEQLPVKQILSDTVYGGMPIQIGYCNGKNNTYNGFEYHKGSEINVAVTDFMLVLGHSYDIKNNRYDVSEATVFYVPKGCAIEMYQTTLHLSPLRVCDEGFKGIVVLPKGTNTPLTEEEKDSQQKYREALRFQKNADSDSLKYQGESRQDNSSDMEQQLLLQRNKWVIAHPKREPLIRQGAYPGVIGENKQLFY